MRYPKFLKRQEINTVIIIIIGIVFILVNYLNRPEPFIAPEYNPPPKVIEEPRSSDAFPSPNKEQKVYSSIIQVGELAYWVEPATTSYSDRRVLQNSTYYVYYENSLNSPHTFKTSPALNVGCIAANNKSYGKIPSIFSAGDFSPAYNSSHPSTSLEALNQRGLAFQPYERVRVEIAVNGSCQYLGTQDGKYWWKIP